VHDPWAEPERHVDAVVTAFWLGRLEPADRVEWLRLARRWLRPGGLHALLELGAGASLAAGVAPPARLDDQTGPRPIEPDELVGALDEAGYVVDSIGTGGSIMRALARARAG
jgi:hypothetical protein